MVRGQDSRKQLTKGADSNSSTFYSPSSLFLCTTELIPGNHLRHEIAYPEQDIGYISQEFEVHMGELFYMPNQNT